MRGKTHRSAMARVAGLVAMATTLLVTSNESLPAAAGELLPKSEQTLPALTEADLVQVRDRARPIDSIADDDLSSVVSRVTAGQPAGSHVLAEESMILIDVRHSLSSDEIEAAVAATGGRVYQHISDSYVEAFVPAPRISSLEALAGVDGLHLPPQPVHLTDLAGSVAGQSVAKANAPAWHSAGFRGNGVAVGIIDSFHGAAWNQALASGDVPNPDSVFCRIGGSACNLWTISPGALHGTAVAEVIHDMAPSAPLHVADAFTPGDYIAVIDHFTTMGVKVVNHSRSWSFDGPGDGTGVAAAIVNYAASRGILWVMPRETSATGVIGGGFGMTGMETDGSTSPQAMR